MRLSQLLLWILLLILVLLFIGCIVYYALQKFSQTASKSDAKSFGKELLSLPIVSDQKAPVLTLPAVQSASPVADIPAPSTIAPPTVIVAPVLVPEAPIAPPFTGPLEPIPPPPGQ